MAVLTTHVIDTSREIPACGVRIELRRCSEHARQLLAMTTTAADGRTQDAIASGDQLSIGKYELSAFCEPTDSTSDS